jgi:hypothetical protein
MNKLDKIISNERGAIAIVALVLFFVITLSLFSIYRFVVADYVTSTYSIEQEGDKLQQSNLIESIKSNYVKDMKNDIDYDGMKDKLGLLDENNQSPWKLDYLNYAFEYTKLDEDGNEETDKGKFGRFYWERFRNYDEIIPVPILIDSKYKRTYDVRSNWEEKTNTTYDDGKLMLPESIYIEVVFGSGVSSIDLNLGNSFESKSYNFINRGQDKEIFKLENLPPTVSEIEVESSSPLRSTYFSVLKAREIDVEVFEKDNLDRIEGEKVLLHTLRIELGKNKNVIKFLGIGSEVE